jgi:hypothetical protein
MKRTYVLFALVLLAAGYVFKMKLMGGRDGLEAAKDRIRHIDQQPVAHQEARRPKPIVIPLDRPLTPQDQQAEATQMVSEQRDAIAPANEHPVRLAKGTFTVVDGTVVYSPDAQLDIGRGMLVSSPTGVMVSDADMQHISGDLVVDPAESTTTMLNAFITITGNSVETTSDSAETVKKEAPK